MHMFFGIIATVIIIFASFCVFKSITGNNDKIMNSHIEACENSGGVAVEEYRNWPSCWKDGLRIFPEGM